MKTETYERLKEIQRNFGATQFGQICQNLLALSFVELGCSCKKIEVNNVEGVDILIYDEQFGKYAVEVKTTSGNIINFGEKDHRGLRRYSENGYKPILAVLKIDLFGGWILCNAEKLHRSQNINVDTLYTDEDLKNLAKSLNEMFENIVETYYQKILEKGQQYLQEILKEKGIKYTGA